MLGLKLIDVSKTGPYKQLILRWRTRPSLMTKPTGTSHLTVEYLQSYHLNVDSSNWLTCTFMVHDDMKKIGNTQKRYGS